jgi:hypothetical protein
VHFYFLLFRPSHRPLAHFTALPPDRFITQQQQKQIAHKKLHKMEPCYQSDSERAIQIQ